MSALFPVSELLTIAAFAAGMITLLIKATPRPQRVVAPHVTIEQLLAARTARAGSRSDNDNGFPSTAVC